MIRAPAVGIALLLMAWSDPAAAICVQNRTPNPVEVQMIHGGSYETTVPGSAQLCCDWRERQCNVEGVPGALVGLELGPPGHFAGRRARDAPAGCRATLPAGGTLVVRLENFDVGGGEKRLGLHCTPARR